MAFLQKGKNLARANAIVAEMNNKRRSEPSQETTTGQTIEQPSEQTIEQPSEQQQTEVITQEATTEEPQAQTTVEEQVTTQPTIEVDDTIIYNRLSEKLGREITSYEDLTPQQTQQPELDPELQQLLEWKNNTGLSLSQWSNYNRDFSKLSDLEVAREIQSIEYPNLTSEELDYALKDYIYNEDEDEESDRIKKSIALKKYAKQGREALEKNRITLQEAASNPKLSKEQQTLIEYAQKAQEQANQATTAQTAYNNNIKQASLGLNAINLNLGENLQIQYEVTDEQKGKLPDLISKMPHWYNQDGSFNHENIVKDGIKIQNFDSIVQKVYQQGIAFGKESKIKADNNITLGTTTQPQGGAQEKKGNVGEVVNNILGKRRSKLRFNRPK
jgi:hypothetical protein